MADRPSMLSPEELAGTLGISVNTVYQWNSRGDGPRRYRVGKHVRYRLSDVEDWLNDHAVQGSALDQQP